MSSAALAIVEALPPQSAPRCPRCGYDQSGLAASWEGGDQCPLRGVCSECGFEFEWGRVLNAEKYKLPWLFEHSPGRRPAIRRAWRTWQRVILPWRFWRASDGMRLDTPHNWWRLMLWLPVLIAGVWVIGSTLGICQNLAMVFFDPAYASARRLGMGWDWWVRAITGPYLAPIGRFMYLPSGSYGFSFNLFLPYPVKAWAACCVLMPTMLLILPRTRGMVKVRPVHVGRAAVYGMGLLLVWPLNMYLDSVVSLIPAVQEWMWTHYYDQFYWPLLMVQACGALLGVVWFAMWWWVVLVRVFALPNGRWVWGLLMAACVLAAVAVAAFDDQFAMLIFR